MPGVDETFVSYEKYILDHVSKAVEPYVTIQESQGNVEMDVQAVDELNGAVPVEESEDWQDAPVKPNNFEPIYPSDEE